MRYLESREGWYVYNRRIPKFLSKFDARTRIRIALNTQCQSTAIQRLMILNQEIEQYWKGLVEANETHSKRKFKELISISRQLGFAYMPTSKVLESKLEEIIERLLTVKKFSYDKSVTQALLGGQEKVILPLSKALEMFWEYSKPTLLKKNLDQQRKWKNPRNKAVQNFIKSVGDLNILEMTNLDMVRFRDWWLGRSEKETVKYNTINKDFTHLKGIIETVSDHQGLEIDIDKLFKKIHLKEGQKQKRESYSSDFIRDKILKSKTLSTLHDEVKAVVHLCIETGARPIEIVNLCRDDIFTNVSIPYIHIRPRKGYSLKTIESERKIPLIGKALEMIKNYPQGLIRYHAKADLMSRYINRYLNEHNLRPTKKHSLYSFRHSFQDRLNRLELPDRIQCQLMGHKFQRPKYGDGASLEHLQKIMQKISLTS